MKRKQKTRMLRSTKANVDHDSGERSPVSEKSSGKSASVPATNKREPWWFDGESYRETIRTLREIVAVLVGFSAGLSHVGFDSGLMTRTGSEVSRDSRPTRLVGLASEQSEVGQHQ